VCYCFSFFSHSHFYKNVLTPLLRQQFSEHGQLNVCSSRARKRVVWFTGRSRNRRNIDGSITKVGMVKNVVNEPLLEKVNALEPLFSDQIVQPSKPNLLNLNF